MNQEKLLDWYQREIEKDKIELESHKVKLIKSLEKVDKTKLFDKEIKKQSLWKRILKVLGTT